MATIVNQREVLLQATVPRMIAVSKNFITVTAPTNTFSTTATGTSPNSIIVRASLSGELRGTVAWTTSPSVAAVVDGNIITIAASLVPPGTSVTITATLTAYGQTYTNSAVISNTAETVVSSLSSTGVSVSTAADGSGGNYASATSTMKVEIGTVDNSSAWTYSWSVPAGVTATGATTRTISVSAMTVAVDTAALTCTATRTGWPTQTKTFTVSKSKAGLPGDPGAPGDPGTPGLMRTEISVYKWTTDTIPPAYPTGSGTYTWATGEYSAPAGWDTSIPLNTTPGSTLWKVTISLVANADITTTAFTWTAPVPVTFVDAATTDFSSNISGNATIPVGTQVGDTVFIFVGSDAGTGLGLPAGWSTVVFDTANTVGIRIAYKQMLSSVDANVLVNGLSTASVAVTRTYRGSIDFGNIQHSIATAATASTADAPLLNITTQQGVVVASAFIDDDNITSVVAPANYANLSWFSSATAEFNVLTADKAYSTAVSENPAAFTTNIFSDAATTVTLSIPLLRTGVASISSLGATGTRGSRELYSSDAAHTATFVYLTNGQGAPSYAAKATALIAAATVNSNPTTPINGDTVTFSNGSNYVYTITHNGTAWVTPGTVIDGSLLVTGSVTAAKINSNGLTIRDAAGNIILSAGATLAASSLNIPGTVSNVPAGWQNSGITLSAAGVLTGAGGGSVTATGLGAVKTDLTNAPASILNSNVTLTSLGAASASSVTNKLDKSSADVLSATISINAVTGAGFRAGNLTWDSTGAVTPISGSVAGGNAVYGKGVAMTPGGLTGHNGTKTTFAINATTGNAIFSGDITGASGTFSGSITGATGTFAGTVSAGNVTGALMRATTVPPSYSGARFALSNAQVTFVEAGATYWKLNGAGDRRWVHISGFVIPAPEGTVAHKIAAVFTVSASAYGGQSQSMDLEVMVATRTTMNMDNQWNYYGEVMSISGTSGPYNNSVTVSGATQNTFSTLKTVDIFVSANNCDSILGNYTGLIWGVR